jgi:hypothetical protein
MPNCFRLRGAYGFAGALNTELKEKKDRNNDDFETIVHSAQSPCLHAYATPKKEGENCLHAFLDA